MAIEDPNDLEPTWNDVIQPKFDALFPPDQDVAMGYYRTAEARLAP
ncbi:MAG: hypothetical protein MZV49_12180 [Rhodopseudomonas palustris]|nr:hypothetical protein [Rhodopseudomonas palustris]